jgi:hypothetical protein
MDVLSVDEMTLEEVKIRLLSAFRSGDLSIDLKGPVLGFAAAMKRGNPSPKQIELARKLVRESRYLDGTEPVNLIDNEDQEDGATVNAQAEWADF